MFREKNIPRALHSSTKKKWKDTAIRITKQFKFGFDRLLTFHSQNFINNFKRMFK